MLTFSKKAQKMPASPIRKLVPYADAAKKRGIKVYHLNIGQPDIASPKEALDAVKNNQLKLEMCIRDRESSVNYGQIDGRLPDIFLT